MAISVLPDEVVSRIAAGEAVERPASAVKELIENAIDAGASSVHVEVRGGGRQLIRVSDNGSGIRAADLAFAFRRHATSKLRDAEELAAVSTLGFRGEALASIAAVSRASIVTRHREEELGASLHLEAGVIQQRRKIGAPAGVVINIENLFFNTPARLKFLKKDLTEKRHVYWVVARYALAYPGIAFTLILDGRERFRSSGSGALADVVSRVFGVGDFKRMQAFESVDRGRPGQPDIAVAGYASLPPLSRASRDRIILFVNGRAIQHSALSHAVTQAYEGLLNSGAYPLTVARVTTPPEFVDVNVHPAKAEVRFREPNLVYAALQRGLREALIASQSLAAASDLWSESGFSDRVVDYPRPAPNWLRARDPLFDEDDWERVPDLAQAPAKPRTLPVLRVVGQIGAAYIIAEGPAGLYLVDQNAAHETVLAEQIGEALANGGLKAFAPEETETLLLSPEDAALLTELADTLAALGFEIEPFGPNTFVVRSAPELLAGQRLDQRLPFLLAQLRARPAGEDSAVQALAAAAAVAWGKVLDGEEMANLISRLERCPSPLISPSGKKTLIHLSREQLAREFGRP